MNSSINLVSSKNDEVEKEQRRLRIVRIIAAACLVIVALFSVLIFIVNFTLPLDAVKKNQQLELANISSMHKKLTEYTLLNDRISNITSLISKRKNYNSIINAIYLHLPKDLAIQSLGVDDTGAITLGVSGASLLSMNDFINSLIQLKDKDKIIKKINIQSLSLNSSSGLYLFTAETKL